MSKKRTVFLGVGLVIILVGVLALIGAYSGKSPLPGEPFKRSAQEKGVKGNEGNITTKEEVPEEIEVPEMGATNTPSEVAVPETVAEAAPGVKAKFRRFEIKAEKGIYTPSIVVINKGDTVHIDFTAVDKKYDFVIPDYGLRQVADAGQTKIIEFQAIEKGKFLFYSELYGGAQGKMKGYIIVK